VCLLEQLNVNETIYLGHSMSAMIGCMAARKRPELFQHLILLSGSPRYLNDKGYNGGFERSELDTIFTQIDEKFSSWVKNFTPVAVGVKCTSAITQFQSSLGRMKPKIALSVARTVFLSDMRWFCHKFQCLAPSSNPKKMSSFRNPLHST
jgi:pimeloyl-ACP methyl ester carboxylesterase